MGKYAGDHFRREVIGVTPNVAITIRGTGEEGNNVPEVQKKGTFNNIPAQPRQFLLIEKEYLFKMLFQNADLESSMKFKDGSHEGLSVTGEEEKDSNILQIYSTDRYKSTVVCPLSCQIIYFRTSELERGQTEQFGKWVGMIIANDIISLIFAS